MRHIYSSPKLILFYRKKFFAKHFLNSTFVDCPEINNENCYICTLP